jgi:hypothetical protein
MSFGVRGFYLAFTARSEKVNGWETSVGLEFGVELTESAICVDVPTVCRLRR